MLTKIKMALSIAIVLGAGTAAPAMTRHLSHRDQQPMAERQDSRIGPGRRAHGSPLPPDDSSQYQGPGHVIAGWEV